MMTEDEALEVLGIGPSTDFVAAHRAYRARARACHPDTGPADDRAARADEMARVNQAWSILREKLQAPVLEEGPTTSSRPRVTGSRRTSVMVAVVGVLALGAAGLAVGLSGDGPADPEDYVGSCLTAEGGVVDCDDDGAEVEVVEPATSAQDCAGQVFASRDGDTFFCTRPARA